jgi:hypothetical protein
MTYLTGRGVRKRFLGVAAAALLSENTGDDGAEWPAYSTCKAGRPDHGSNGA